MRASRAARFEAQFAEHRVEGAAFAAVAPENPFDIEQRGIETLCDRLNLRRRDEEEHGFRIDKAADEPGAGNAVDLGLERVTLPCARADREGQFAFGHERQARLRPGLWPPRRIQPTMPRRDAPARNALADRLTIFANDDR